VNFDPILHARHIARRAVHLLLASDVKTPGINGVAFLFLESFGE